MRRQILVTLDIDGPNHLDWIDVELIENFLAEQIETLPVQKEFEIGLAVEEFPPNSEIFLGEVNES